MLFVDSNGGRIHYRLDVPPAASRDTTCVMLSNSLGTNLSMWDPQVASLLRHFRVLRYDTRGHSLSSVTPGPYTNEQLAGDVIRLLDSLQIERAHFCGLSMGGMAGMRLGVAAPERIEKLVLCSTGAKIGSAESWKTRIDTVLEKGMAAVTETIIDRWFTPAFKGRNPSIVERIRQMLLECSPEGYVACSAAVRDTDEREAINRIRARTLVISGRYDPATPPADGRFLASKISGARYVELEGSHLSNIECADEFNSVLLAFLQGP
jgi:3-oxoadipate enol-lactonase